MHAFYSSVKTLSNSEVLRYMWALRGAIGLSFAGIFAWNESEPYRIAKSIKNGSHFLRSQSKDRILQELCPVSLEEIKRRMAFGIVGPKSTGKSYTLTALGYELQNVIKFTLNSSNYGVGSESAGIGLPETILSELRKRVYTVPWPFTRFRISSVDASEIISNIFKQVHRDTGIPVTLLLDIDIRTHNLYFSCEKLTRELKAMVCDAEMMYCVFAASEGLLFQVQARREPRLKLFHSKELSIKSSTAYLKKFEKIANVDIADLYCFPRIFGNLHDYGVSHDKKAFIDAFIKSNNEVLQRITPSQRNFLKNTLSHADFGIADYKKHELTEEEVMELVNKNILILNRTGRFEIQFDSWKHTIARMKENS
jgi:hypothetical protein